LEGKKKGEQWRIQKKKKPSCFIGSGNFNTKPGHGSRCLRKKTCLSPGGEERDGLKRGGEVLTSGRDHVGTVTKRTRRNSRGRKDPRARKRHAKEGRIDVGKRGRGAVQGGNTGGKGQLLEKGHEKAREKKRPMSTFCLTVFARNILQGQIRVG